MRKKQFRLHNIKRQDIIISYETPPVTKNNKKETNCYLKMAANIKVRNYV